MLKVMAGEADVLPEGNYLKVPEVCRLLNVSRTLVYSLMDRGELSYAKFGRSRRVPSRSVEDFIRRQTIASR